MAFFQKHPVIVCLALLCLVLLVWSVWGTHSPKTTNYTVQSPKLPAAFDGLRILQVSDLHNAQFGKDNRKLLQLLKDAQPDIILLTGDLIDSKRTDLDPAIAFCQTAVTLAPTYYAPGNHESRIPESYNALKAELSRLGVTILENESQILTRGEEEITLTGLLDPDFGIPWPDVKSENYQIVLSHRPERLAQYAHMGLDLVFTGHAHGGQFRLPFAGGLFAPHQGFFPEYTAGIHTLETTSMVVSRGLGNCPLIPRFNNRPELILVTLKAA
jgi:predicted MPP superfamily phosphohydrolase